MCIAGNARDKDTTDTNAQKNCGDISDRHWSFIYFHYVVIVHINPSDPAAVPIIIKKPNSYNE